MNKSKTRKSRAAKSVRSLPVKTLDPKSAKGVRAGTYLQVTLTAPLISGYHPSSTGK
jgi:hypothetical protein